MVGWRDHIRFDRNELAGSFGDIGTDFPLIVGMILAAGLDTASTFILFGAMQVLTGLVYGLPMPVQPLKAMAVIVIAGHVRPEVLYGGGLAIGLLMLALTLTGLLGRIAEAIPRAVVRGLQLGLGTSLALLALKDYVQSDGPAGYVLAGVAFAVTLLLLGNRRFPAALVVILLGFLYAVAFQTDVATLLRSAGPAWPVPRVPRPAHVLEGLLVLALPQLALSIGNSVIATRQALADLFPDRPVTVRHIGLTYSLMNIIQPFFSGIPTCHGSGGVVGHHAFGGRTGGTVVLYGALYLAIGLGFSRGLGQVIGIFPLPVLGVMLLFEGVSLMALVRDVAPSRGDLVLCLLVAVAGLGLPNGYVIGLVGGTVVALLIRRGLVLRH